MKFKFKFKYIRFISTLFFYRFIYRKRLKIEGFNIGFEKDSKLIIDSNSLVEIGRRSYFVRLVNIEAYDGASITLGRNVFFNKNCCLVSRYGINIGKNSQFGPNVCIYDHNHEFRKNIPIVDQGFYGKPINIGENVWVGAGCFIGSGVTIGDNTVIAANTIVLKDINKNSMLYTEVKNKSIHISKE